MSKYKVWVEIQGNKLMTMDNMRVDEPRTFDTYEEAEAFRKMVWPDCNSGVEAVDNTTESGNNG